ncbi:hypothetical protein BGZ76_002446, partial [Entomortierella beljakovae]
MSVSVPSYTSACIVTDASGLNVYLVGVPVTNENRLEMYLVNLSNINAPTATFIASQVNTVAWRSSAPKVCLSYPGNQASTNSPVLVYQLGPQSFATNIYPNGTVPSPGNFDRFYFMSNKLFSFTGAVGTLDWATGFTNQTYSGTGSAWTGIRFNSTSILESSHDVGTYLSSQNTPAQGYNVVFDQSGAGMIYTVLSTASDVNTGSDRVQTLSSPVDVDMNSYSISKNAVSVTMGNVGYILDRAPDGSTILYSISPGQSTKLQLVSPSGNVPTFTSNIVGTAVGTKLVTYGTTTSGAVYFNSFDTTGKSWTGPGLVKAYAPSGGGDNNNNDGDGGNTGGGSKSNVGAIAGGVVGGIVVLALIAFIFYRRRPKPKPVTSVAQHAVDPKFNPAAAPLMDQNYVLQQQQLAQSQDYQNQQQMQQMQQMQQIQQQQQFSPQQQYIPQQQEIYTSQPAPAYQTQPVFFQPQPQPQPQPQEAYTYVPPTVLPQPQTPQQPTIFQPQTSGASPENAYSHASYPPAGASTPQTLSQPYTPTHSNHTPASP